MNVYQKLNAAREKFHATKLTKTGENKFAGYKYFELGDFLIPALSIFKEVGLCATVSFDKDTATMTIRNIDKPDEFICLTSPMGSAALKGCHEVQNIGAVETYQRRYLWVAALEIVEHDALDATTGSKNVEPAKTPRQIELEELAGYMVECHDEGKDMEAIKVWYSAETWNKDAAEANEERIYVWGLLKPYSKLRSTIKANSPEELAKKAIKETA